MSYTCTIFSISVASDDRSEKDKALEILDSMVGRVKKSHEVKFK